MPSLIFPAFVTDGHNVDATLIGGLGAVNDNPSKRHKGFSVLALKRPEYVLQGLIEAGRGEANGVT